MTTFFEIIRTAIGMALFALSAGAIALPGAHGPGGEHLDGAAAQAASQGARPRIEAKSELFELVGYLHDSELSVMINRFETNEPVLNASVEIASDASKANAKFHSDHGDYAVDDPALLKLLSRPGPHPLIFTIIAGNDSDLLEGTLNVALVKADARPHGHSHWVEYLLIGTGWAVVIAIAVVPWRRRTRRRLGHPRRVLS